MNAIRFTLGCLGLLLLLGGCATTPNVRRHQEAAWHIDPDSDAQPVRISISGQVKRQGSYTFPARTTLSAVVSRADGFTDFAYLRRIQVARRDGAVEHCDFWKVRQQADLDVVLSDGDRVTVSKIAPL